MFGNWTELLLVLVFNISWMLINTFLNIVIWTMQSYFTTQIKAILQQFKSICTWQVVNFKVKTIQQLETFIQVRQFSDYYFQRSVFHRLISVQGRPFNDWYFLDREFINIYCTLKVVSWMIYCSEFITGETITRLILLWLILLTCDL